MKSLRCLAMHASAVLVLGSLALPNADAVTIDMVTVGNPGNAADSRGLGSVNDSYQIGKYEVTIGQYVSFLNAVASSDTYGLYDGGLDTSNVFGAPRAVNGIARNGSSGSYSYTAFGP